MKVPGGIGLRSTRRGELKAEMQMKPAGKQPRRNRSRSSSVAMAVAPLTLPQRNLAGEGMQIIGGGLDLHGFQISS